MPFSLDEIFKASGGRISRERLESFIERAPLNQYDKEYLKQVMKKFDTPYYSPGITKEEFLKGLLEVEKNARDSIEKYEVDRIKKFFGIKK
jgi:hypothetical protein